MAEDRYVLLKKSSKVIALGKKVNGHQIYMFRDDPEDFGFGGNKVRFFEYLIPEILRQKPEILVTSGSLYSNHIRVTAQVAAHLGLPCQLLITEDSLPDELFGNAALAVDCGAELIPVGHFAAMMKIDAHIESLRQAGKKVFQVPNGGHTASATQAYAGVAIQALEELEGKNIQPAGIYLPCASGTTHSGILCAKSKRSLPPVVSFAVANKPNRAVKGISRLIQSAESYWLGLEPDPITVLDCGKNDYGHPDQELLNLREDLIQTDGITLDQTYNINAFYGMTKALEERPGQDPVLYINTGGYTALQ